MAKFWFVFVLWLAVQANFMASSIGTLVFDILAVAPVLLPAR